MSLSTFNRRWAAVILQALHHNGVRHVCIAPGSRSTPLTLAATQTSGFVFHTHFDERGLGHLALGLAKASGTPVAVIVTSGTAVANIYPAVIEAGLTGEKLVVLTADRPPELINCGANQAIVQPGIYGAHPAATLNLPRPTESIPARWLASAIDSEMGVLRHGALHINCPFAEPLYGEMDDTGLTWQQALGNWWQGEKPWQVYTASGGITQQPDWHSWRQKKGVVIAGRMTAQEGERVANWASTLGWPLISDVQSHTGQPLPHADLWLANPGALQVLEQARIVVQFGASLTSKRLLQWQASGHQDNWWLVDPLPGRLDPGHHRGRRIQATVEAWLDLHPAHKQVGWAEALRAYVQQAAVAVEKEIPASGEAGLAKSLPRLLPEKGQLFIGNSLSVRLVDALAQLPCGYPVYGNRGASGIDGLVATLAGVSRATCRPTLAVLGDLSALYDLNSLALLRASPAPVALVVVNNNGGQIFSLLPTPAEVRSEFYAMPQNVDFRHAAALFGLPYIAPQSLEELAGCLKQCWSGPAVATVIELKVPEAEGAAMLQKLVARASQQ
ncbi:2-succinyl-5-enolpyruvyl-6-hydroxy-3-cyclohexene-1-carboxylic-acid synthase [Mangrovibacter phragmitis]|uniref:2-succinyl-5-enolpyruvyl-6-hydroxy-3-cyclohexene-1-carboxylate synthase n=1 Tax=Mangrovibacter phragmitis TaxID=1691903 RepID=A0A1B7LAB9_9ENTR|nr:2-succinyl-5-enolpyruvyl-6-hydroxy-3-cyclohexene-1-carboxylic-acid synthase [Mangrovibacter phragmitis]OAT79267.1 2-succinyl-5-enolpyruvyl-6-hydroxy-3-cyclohexene-1-carboxylic-acid synthase [Mangrovibacter phragmitis]